MKPARNNRKPAAIPAWALLALVVICVAGAFFLMPNRRALLERQLADGKTEQALETLAAISPQERKADAEFYALKETQLKRAAAKTPQEKREALAGAVRAAVEFDFKTNFLAELLAAAAVAENKDVQELLGPALAKAPVEAHRQFANDLVRRSLAEGKPAEAAAIYSNFWARARNDVTGTELARLYRQADQATNALATLAEAREPAALRELADVAKSLGRLDVATNALAKLRAGDPADANLMLERAQVLEWSNAPELAFEEYLAALRHGDARALTNAFALAGPLGRGEALLDVLAGKPGLLTTPELRLRVGKLAANSARFNEAKAAYRAALKERPQDFDLLVEFGGLLMNLFDYEEAAKVFEQAKEVKPAALAPYKALAEIRYRLRDYDGALEAYKWLASRTKDEEVIKAYITMAESLGDTEAMIDGLRRQIARTNAPSAYDFERLAFNLHLLGRTNDSIAALQEGLKSNAANAELALNLAYAHSNRGEFDRSAEILATRKELGSRRDFANLYLSVLIRAQKFKEAESFLASGAPAEILEDPETLGLRAQVAEGLNDRVEALRIYERLHRQNKASSYFALNYARLLAMNARPKESAKILEPFLANPTEETLTLAAQIYSEAGDYKTAEDWQRRVVERFPSARAWGFLGDILLSRGDKANARRAYQKGVDLMVEKLASKK